jgi:hypothetical protein
MIDQQSRQNRLLCWVAGIDSGGTGRAAAFETIEIDGDMIEPLGWEAERHYSEIVVGGPDPPEVAQEHQRSMEIVKKNVRRVKERKEDLEEAGYGVDNG